MRAVILSDNIPWGDLEGEWGLSVYITYRDKRILLDAGALRPGRGGRHVHPAGRDPGAGRLRP